jgi:hypothetical protein
MRLYHDRREKNKMTHIGRIVVKISTGNDPQADANGRVFLGFGPREFRLNTAADNFKRGAVDETFILGNGNPGDPPPNVKNPNENDPAQPIRIEGNDVGKKGTSAGPALFDVYIRFEPEPENRKWELLDVTVTATGGPGSSFPGTNTYKVGNSSLGGGNITPPGIWLGNDFGKVVYLQKQN